MVVTWRTLAAVEVALPQSGLDALRDLNIVIRDLSVLSNRIDLARIAPNSPESREKLMEANDFASIRFTRQDFARNYAIFPDLPPVRAAMEEVIKEIDALLEGNPPLNPAALEAIGTRVKKQSSVVSQFYYRFSQNTESVLADQQVVLGRLRIEMAMFLLLVCGLSAASVILLLNRTAVLRRIRYLSNHDALTGLPNRAWFVENVPGLLRDRDSDLGWSLMLLDLDRFKEVNDTFGHLTGDEVLVEAARRFSKSARTDDVVVRLAGDEFAILAPRIADREDALSLARRIGSEYSGVVALRGYNIPLSCSIGVAVCPADGTTVDELLMHADLALYAAKRAGRGRPELYTSALSEALTSRMAMENAIARALKADEFSLVWQPQINLADGQIEGAEVLLRWFDRERAVWVPPSEFIPVAEDSELILQIDRYVLKAACLEGAAIQAGTGRRLRISVNVSGGNFECPEFPETVAGILAQTGYPADLLELEITEGVLIRNRKVSSRVIDRLAELGVRIALDDFGTGYSSMSYLVDLNLNRLKIDRSFLQEISSSKRKQSIVQAIVHFAHAMDLETVGEGVETVTQYEALKQAGCTSVQGFYFSPPLAVDEFIRWAKKAGRLLPRPALRLVGGEMSEA